VNLRQLANRLARYGVSVHDWTELTSSGCCPLCLKPYSDRPARRAVLDHDHVTGLARGSTCSACNYKLGTLGDDLGWLQRAVAYLSDPPAAALPGERRRALGGPPPS
jgi:hypothetical protein